MTEEIEWLKKGGDRVLRVEMELHHAPLYFTLLMDNIIEVCYDIDYPNREKDIPISVPKIDRIEKMIKNSKETKKVELENSPYLKVKEKPEPLIPPNRAVRVELPLPDGDTTIQNVIQLQNGKHVSISEKINGNNILIGLTSSKLRKKLMDEEVKKQSVPRHTVGIPRNPLNYIPEDTPTLSQN